MRVQLPRYLIAAGVCLLLGVVGPAASAGAAATPRKVDPKAAAAACVIPRAHAGKPTNATITKLSRLVSCVLRAERKQLGLGYARSGSLSRMVDGALKQFIGLPYLAHNQRQLVQPAEQRAGDHIVKSFCRDAGPGVSRGGWEFANRGIPPAVSPVQVANLVARSLQAPDAIARASSAKFGVAARTGLLFRHGDRKGVSFGVIAVTCS